MVRVLLCLRRAASEFPRSFEQTAGMLASFRMMSAGCKDYHLCGYRALKLACCCCCRCCGCCTSLPQSVVERQDVTWSELRSAAFTLRALGTFFERASCSRISAMSTAAKFTLGATTLSAVGIVVFVHFSQRWEREVSSTRMVPHCGTGSRKARPCMPAWFETWSSSA